MFSNFGLRLRHCDRYVIGTANSVVLIALKSFDFFKILNQAIHLADFKL